MKCSFCLRTKLEVELHKGFLIEAPKAPGIYICSNCVVRFKRDKDKEELRSGAE